MLRNLNFQISRISFSNPRPKQLFFSNTLLTTVWKLVCGKYYMFHLVVIFADLSLFVDITAIEDIWCMFCKFTCQKFLDFFSVWLRFVYIFYGWVELPAKSPFCFLKKCVIIFSTNADLVYRENFCLSVSRNCWALLFAR